MQVEKELVMRIKTILRGLVKTLNEIIAPDSDAMVIDSEFGDIYRACASYTVKTTTKTSLYALYKGAEYVVRNNIPGDIVECGVWKGGSAMLIAYTLLKMREPHRKIYLYDTYAGMIEPTEEDTAIPDGTPALQKWRKNKFSDWGRIPLEEAESNVRSTGYPRENLIFVKGQVEHTIPNIMPAQISLLRLDTDWYESTRHEFVHLYPRLSQHGVVVIDDYGYWAGAKRAADEYFLNQPILLNRINETVRIGIKITRGL